MFFGWGQGDRIDPQAQAFKLRVEAAGGTFEAMPCLIALNTLLKGIDLHPEVDAFQARVIAAGGVFEAKKQRKR